MIENITIIMTPTVIIETLNPIGIGKNNPPENTTIIPTKAKVSNQFIRHIKSLPHLFFHKCIQTRKALRSNIILFFL